MAESKAKGKQALAYVVVEEEERYGDYPVALLGVYLDEKAAQAAVEALREDHDWEEDDENWCLCCGQSWTYRTVDLYDGKEEVKG